MDAEHGYRSHCYDYNMGTARRSADEDGYDERECRLREQWEEEEKYYQELEKQREE